MGKYTLYCLGWTPICELFSLCETECVSVVSHVYVHRVCVCVRVKENDRKAAESIATIRVDQY